MTDFATINQRIAEAQRLKADWNRKAQRLYEIVMDLDPGQHTRVDVEETAVNYLLLNCELKTGALLRNYRGARLVVRPRADDVQLWLNEQLKPGTHRDMHLALKDRYITGLGVLGVGIDPYTGELTWYRVNPIQFWWDIPSGFHHMRWCARYFWAPRGGYYEYWDYDTHAILDQERRVVEYEPNPLERLPFACLVGLSAPNIHFPIGDVELTYPQQTLLREVRRAILDHARRGAGLMLVDETAIPEEELYKLAEPGEPYIRVRQLNSVQPVPTPPINAEWLQIETVAKSDLDAQSGVSEYLRGSMPVANNLQFATQVLAALGAQNLRIEIDWQPVKDAMVHLADTTLRWAKHNKVHARIGDISIRLDTIQPDTLTVMVQEDATSLVQEAGLAQLPQR